jgi:O-antigen/teichoic acid export membrane protein
MLRRLLHDTATYGVVSLANRLLVLLLFPVYARTLAPSELGSLDLVSSVGAVLVLVLSLEIVSAHARFAADTPAGSAERATVAATAWAGLLVVVMPAAAVMALLREPLLSVIGLGESGSALATPALVLWVALVVQYMAQNHLRWESRKGQFAAVSLLQGTLTLGLGAWLVVVQGQGARGALIGTASGVVASALLGLYFLRHDLRARPDPGLWQRMMAFCLPIAAGNLLMVAAQNADRFLLARLAGLEEVAQYGIALRFGLVASLIAGSAQMAMGPLVYDNQSSGQLGATLRQATALYALLGAALLCGFSLLAPELVQLLASSRYAQSANLVGMATTSALLYGANMLFPGLWLARKTRTIGACYAVYSVMLVGFATLGLQNGGVRGLALGVLLANAVYISLVAGLSHRVLPAGVDRASLRAAGVAMLIGLAASAWPPQFALRAALLVTVLAVLATTGWRQLKRAPPTEDAAPAEPGRAAPMSAPLQGEH